MLSINKKITTSKKWVISQESLRLLALSVSGLLLSVLVAAQSKKFELNNNNSPLKDFTVTSGQESHPVFVDIDGDGKIDAFSGEFNYNGIDSKIYFLKNFGTNEHPAYKRVTGAANPLEKLSVPGVTNPNFVDLDGDGDYDMFTGDGNSGALRFYKNIGTASQPVFEKQSAAMNPLTMVKYYSYSTSEIAFADVDGDGDYDCLVINLDGEEFFFRNIGNAKEPRFQYVEKDEDPFSFLNETETNGPSFFDYNNDGLIDLFLGTKYYKNTGTKNRPAFTLNTTEGPKFSADPYVLPLRWMKKGKDLTVITGTPAGTFNFFTITPEVSALAARSIQPEIQAYPNPSREEFQLNLSKMSNSETILKVTDVHGRTLQTQKVNGSFIKFGKELERGIYFVQVLQGDKVVSAQKIIKN